MFFHIRREGQRWKHTTVPKDQISVAVFHGVSMRTSGLDQIGAPIGVPDFAHLLSCG